MPSHDCIVRVIAKIASSGMTDYFMVLVSWVAELTNGEIVATDRKTARHSYNRNDKLGATHRVSAWGKLTGFFKAGKNRGKI